MNLPNPGDTSKAAAQARLAHAARKRLLDVKLNKVRPEDEAALILEVQGIAREARSAADSALRYAAAANTAAYDSDGMATQNGLAHAALARENARSAEAAAEDSQAIVDRIEKLLTF